MTDNAIITSAQNIAVAINNLARAVTAIYGSGNSPTYSGGTTNQAVVGTGRLNNVTIVTGAAVTVDIYDAKLTSMIEPTNLLVSVDASNDGTFVLNKSYSNGLVVVVGAGVDANITYSPL